MSNKGIRNLMIYNFGNTCWLNGVISKDNPLTYHHIQKKAKKGKSTLENGALLSKEKHQQFNELEKQYPELAGEINRYLKQYKGVYPSEIQERINEIMSLVKPKERVKNRCR